MVSPIDAEIVARLGLGLVLEALGRHLNRTFEHVQLRSYCEGFEERRSAAPCARVRHRAGLKEQLPCQLASNGGQQFAAQRCERGGVDPQHALAGQPDASIGGRKMHEPTQVGIARKR